jgi:membrane protein YqaA with SNARE-associated domain
MTDRTNRDDAPDAPGTDDAPQGWLDRLARHRTGLAAISFAESTVVPIPLETIVVPLMVGHPRRALSIALSIWSGCLVGAALFYALGLTLVDPVVMPVLEWLGLAEDFRQMTERLGTEGLFWTVFLVSFSPAPMQLATLGAGAAQGNLAVFLAAIALSRGLRYFGLAILAQVVGERIAHLNLPKRVLIPGMIVAALLVWGVFQLL